MNDNGRIALSSLAVSASVAAILGISGAAHADPPSGYCIVGPACNLGWNADQGSWSVSRIIWDPNAEGGYGDWVEDPDPNVIQEGGPVSLSTGHWDYGTCGFNYETPAACGCGGTKATDHYDGTPYFWDYMEGDPGYFVPNWEPPYSGVYWQYSSTDYEPVFYPVGTGPLGSYECWESE